MEATPYFLSTLLLHTVVETTISLSYLIKPIVIIVQITKSLTLQTTVIKCNKALSSARFLFRYFFLRLRIFFNGQLTLGK